MPIKSRRILKIKTENTMIYFDKNNLTITVPTLIKIKSCRKIIEPTDGKKVAKTDFTLIKAIARTFKWQDQFDNGEFSSIRQIADNEELKNGSYVARIMRLTTLSPKIIKTILNGTQPRELTLPVLLQPFPYTWKEQEEFFLSL